MGEVDDSMTTNPKVSGRWASTSSTRSVFRLLSAHPWPVFWSAMTGALVSLGGWALAYYVQFVLDRNGDPGALALATVGIGIAVTLRAATSVVRRAVQLSVVKRIEARVAADALERWNRASVRDREKFSAGELLNRVRGLELLRSALEDRALGAAFDAVLLLVAAAVLFRYSPVLAGLALAGTLLPAIVVHKLRISIQDSFVKTQELGGVLNKRLLDMFEGSRDLRICGAEKWMLDCVQESYAQSQSGRQRHLLKLAVIGNVTSLLSAGTSIAILYLGAHAIAFGRLSAGELIFVYTMAGTMLGPLENLVVSWIFFDEAHVALKRCEEMQSETATDFACCSTGSGDSLRLDHVTFSYLNDRPVLENISLEVPRGSTLAIVGESGAGKSTLLAVMAGLYLPQRGSVSWDVNPAENSMRPTIAAVLQEPHLFETTIEKNIRLGLPQATLEQVQQAAERVNADSFIRNLVDGYQTVISRDGIRLSAGQAQRICLARALIRNPQVLLLDEATSNLDAETEAAVWSAIQARSLERITVVVTHRLRTSMNATQIAVMEMGRIVEFGTYDELISRRGRYYDLWKRQSPAPSVPEEVST